MKKSIIVAFVLVLILSCGVVAGPPEWTAVKTDVAPIIDGNFDDLWEKADEYVLGPDIVFNGGTVIVVNHTTQQPTGKFYLLWDKEALYLYAYVVDKDIYFGRNEGVGLNSQMDGIQLCIEPEGNRATDNSYAYIIDMVPDTKGNKGPATWEHWQIKGVAEDIQIAGGRVAKDAYVIEAAIPWSILNNNAQDVEVGTKYPFGMIIMNTSPFVNVHTLLMDYGDGENVIGNPSAWNTMTLVD